MSSENRSSSGVRNLRNIFETKATLEPSNSPDTRGRSPSERSSDKENGYQATPTNKVRASFVPVEPAKDMATLEQQSSAEHRRGSFSEVNGDGQLSELKRLVSEEQGNQLVPEGAIESAMGSRVVTPMKREGEGQLGHDYTPSKHKVDVEPENPDKPTTGAEEEASEMKPAVPANEEAVSGGQALPPVAEDLRSPKKSASSTPKKKAEFKKPTTNGKPAAVSTKAPSKPASSTLKSPASQPKTPSSAKAPSSAKMESPASKPVKDPLRKASRSSLTAPTAASMAHRNSGVDKPSQNKTSPASKSKARETTKPVNLPSHLTAPTASSRAKHDPTAPASTTSTSRISTGPKSKQTASAKPTPRTSLAAQQRPTAGDSHTTDRRSFAPADSSFLERMMKPTASSASKTHEKIEPKSPPRTKATAPKPKVNGTAAKYTRGVSTNSKVEASTTPQEVMPQDASHNTTNSDEAAGVAPTADAGPPATDIGAANDEPSTTEVQNQKTAEPAGNETPIPHTNGTANEALEATPAGLGGEKTIR